jgi:hypothetical protein
MSLYPVSSYNIGTGVNNGGLFDSIGTAILTDQQGNIVATLAGGVATFITPIQASITQIQTNSTTTNASYRLAFLSASSGTAYVLNNASLVYNPNTTTLTITGTLSASQLKIQDLGSPGDEWEITSLLGSLNFTWDNGTSLTRIQNDGGVVASYFLGNFGLTQDATTNSYLPVPFLNNISLTTGAGTLEYNSLSKLAYNPALDTLKATFFSGSATAVFSTTAPAGTYYPSLLNLGTGASARTVYVDSGITYDQATGTLTATNFSGSVSTIATTTAPAGTYYPTFVNAGTGGTSKLVYVDSGISYNPTSDTLTTTNFSGLSSRSSTIDTTTASVGTYYLNFVNAGTGGVSKSLLVDSGLSYNQGTKTLSTTNFSGLSSRSSTIDTTTAPSGTYYPAFVNAGTGATSKVVYVDSGISYDPTIDTLSIPNVNIGSSLNIIDQVGGINQFQVYQNSGILNFLNSWNSIPEPLTLNGNTGDVNIYSLNVIDSVSALKWNLKSSSDNLVVKYNGNQYLRINTASSYLPTVPRLLVIGDGDGSTTAGTGNSGLMLTNVSGSQIDIINDTGTLIIQSDSTGTFQDLIRIAKGGSVSFYPARTTAIWIDPLTFQFNDVGSLYAPTNSVISSKVSIQPNNSGTYMLGYSVYGNGWGYRPFQISWNIGFAFRSSTAGAKSIYVNTYAWSMTKNGSAFSNFAVSGMLSGVGSAITATQVGTATWDCYAPYTQLVLTTTPDIPATAYTTDVYQLVLSVSYTISGITTISSGYGRFNQGTTQTAVISSGSGGSFTFTSATPTNSTMNDGNTFLLTQTYMSIPLLNQVYVSPTFTTSLTQTYTYVFNPNQFANYEITWYFSNTPTAFSTLSIDMCDFFGVAGGLVWNGCMTSLGTTYTTTSYALQQTAPIVKLISQAGTTYRCNLYYASNNKITMTATNNGGISAGAGTTSIPFVSSATHNSTTLYTGLIWSLSGATGGTGTMTVRGFN